MARRAKKRTTTSKSGVRKLKSKAKAYHKRGGLFGKGLEGVLKNPPKDKWIPVHAVKFLKGGIIKLLK